MARSLEKRWEETLRAERQVRDDYDRFLREQPPQLSSEERARIAALSSDLPALWHASGTTHQDRKEIVRHLVDNVVVYVEHNSEYVGVTIHWQGGFTSQHEVVRPVRSYEQLRDFDKLMDRVATLRHEGYSSGQIADVLNREGFSPPKRCGGFYPELVRQLLVRRGLANDKTYVDQLGPHEWWLPKLAEAIPVSAGKLADWARRGWLHSRRTPPQWLWVLWADKQEVKRLRELASLSHRGGIPSGPVSTCHSQCNGRGKTGTTWPPRKRRGSTMLGSFRSNVTVGIAVLVGIAGLSYVLAASAAPPGGTTAAVEFTPNGKMKRPEGYRERIYMGTPLTLNDMNVRGRLQRLGRVDQGFGELAGSRMGRETGPTSPSATSRRSRRILKDLVLMAASLSLLFASVRSPWLNVQKS